MQDADHNGDMQTVFEAFRGNEGLRHLAEEHRRVMTGEVVAKLSNAASFRGAVAQAQHLLVVFPV